MAINRRDLIVRGGATAAALTAGGAAAPAAAQTPIRAKWDHTADVVVIGRGATGLPAAIAAREAGSSVILVEAQPHVGGHARVSGGNVPLGGGTSVQKKYGIEDSPDLVFKDLTDWSVVQPNGFPDYRYNDREIIRAFADNSAATFEWLVAHGVVFVDKPPDRRGGSSVGNSVLRTMHAAPMRLAADPDRQAGDAGPAHHHVDRQRPDAAARCRRAQGRRAIPARAQDDVAPPRERRVGPRHRSRADHKGATVNMRARKAVIIATGGSTGNVNFRRMFDPRLTEEYCGLAGMPYSDQDASGEIAAMAVGASLWGLFNQALEHGSTLTKPGQIGTQYGYVNLRWLPGSPVFDKARATGLRVTDWQNVITVNMLGKRFYDETGRQFTANNYKGVDPYIHGS